MAEKEEKSLLAQAIQPFLDKLVPQSAQNEYAAMKADPAAWAAGVKNSTAASPDVINALANMMPIAGMAKVFKPQAVTDVPSLFQTLISQGSGLRRSSLLPAGKLPSGEIIQGSLGGGHGHLYESLSPVATKGMIEGYVPSSYTNPPIFLTRDQGTLASGDLESIKIALTNLLKQSPKR